jgi:protein dithiol oxidoreductase (disulfide-forming)
MRLMQVMVMSLLAICISFAQFVSAEEMWEKGRHYKELPFKVKTRDPSKIEVVEVFWYGCPHCYEFNNDFLPAWEKSFAEDIDFRLIPATFPGWVVHAEAFFAAEELGKVKEMHQALFDAIQAEPRKYEDKKDFIEIFAKYGVSEEEYLKLYEASGFRKISKIEEQINKTGERIKAYRLTGVPALVVNGKYKIGVREAGGFANMLKIANYLVAKEREEMKAAAGDSAAQ